MTYDEWAATIERGVTINPQMAFEAQQKRIVDLEQATDLAIQINNDLTSQLEHIERERDAAFAMSRCECEANECCANLVSLHGRIAELERERDEYRIKHEVACSTLELVKERRDAVQRALAAQCKHTKDLEAECDELKADAMRYRWLRANSRNDFIYDTANAMATLVRSDKLDAAIDAAIAKVRKS